MYEERAVAGYFDPSIDRISPLVCFGVQELQRTFNQRKLLGRCTTGRERDNPRMQARSLCEPDEIPHVDRDQNTVLLQRVTPEHVICRAAQAAITGVVDIDTQIVKAPRYRGRDIFVEQEL
jgi:hypothetical protein